MPGANTEKDSTPATESKRLSYLHSSVLLALPVLTLAHCWHAAGVHRDNGSFQTDTDAVEELVLQYRKQKGFQRVVLGRGLQQGDTCSIDIQVGGGTIESKRASRGCSWGVACNRVTPAALTSRQAGVNAFACGTIVKRLPSVPPQVVSHLTP